jgi:hypothetical protein
VSDFDAIIAQLEQAITPEQRRQLSDRVMQVIKYHVIAEMPERTGQLKRDVRSRASADGGELEMYAPHAVFALGPTRPHMIYPRAAKALRFQMGGKTVFASSVRHPGTKENDFIGRGLTNAGPDIDAALAGLDVLP